MVALSHPSHLVAKCRIFPFIFTLTAEMRGFLGSIRQVSHFRCDTSVRHLWNGTGTSLFRQRSEGFLALQCLDFWGAGSGRAGGSAKRIPPSPPTRQPKQGVCCAVR